MIAYKKLTTEQKMRARNELLEKHVDDLQRKVEYLEEELRVARATEQAHARRASYGMRYQQ